MTGRKRGGSFTGGILSRDQHLDYQAIFSSYDDDNDGKLTSDQVVQAVRALGNILTKEQAQDIECDVDIEMDCECTYNQFVGILERLKCMKPKRRDLLKAFQAFDSKGRGFINCSRFKTVLQKLGDPLDDDEMEDFMAHANKSGGKEFHYSDLVGAMQGPTKRRLSLFGGDLRNQSKAYKSTEA